MNKNYFNSKKYIERYNHFNSQNFFKDIQEKVREKPYYERYISFKNTLLFLSYFFNLASGITAVYAVYWFISHIVNLPIFAILIAFIFLIFLEKIKRKSSNEFWLLFFFRNSFSFGWFSLSAFCLSLSLVSSGFGVKEGTETFAPSAELIHADSTLTAYQKEIDLLETKSKDLRNNRDSRGITFYKLTDAITANELAIADYRNRTRELEKQLKGKNEQLTTAYKEDVQLTARTLVWLTLLMEILFEACIAYIWYFSFRSYVEWEVTDNQKNSATPIVENSTQLKQTELEESIASLKRQIDDLRAFQVKTVPNPAQSNNNGLTGSLNEKRKPIGFFSYSKKELASSKKDSVQVCTDMYKPFVADYRTVEHIYFKRGKKHVTFYTLSQIKSRVAQYERLVSDAIRRNLSESILFHRKKRLNYWQEKRLEVIDKEKEHSLKYLKSITYSQKE